MKLYIHSLYIVMACTGMLLPSTFQLVSMLGNDTIYVSMYLYVACSPLAFCQQGALRLVVCAV